MANVLGDAPSNAAVAIQYGGTGATDFTDDQFLWETGGVIAASGYDNSSFATAAHDHTGVAIDATGTNQSTWQIDQDNATAHITLKNSAGELQVRNKDDDGYASLRCEDLTVEGTQTVLNTATVTIDDPIIRINDAETHPPSADSGILCYRGGTVADAQILWNETSEVWECGLVGSMEDLITGTAAVTEGGTGVTSCTTGDILHGTGSNTLAVLNVGAAYKPLKVNSGGTDVEYGTLAVQGGGTGLATCAQGDLLYGSAANTITALTKSTDATRYLSNTGASNNPAWSQVNLSNGVTNTLGVTNGGTGLATVADGSVIATTAADTFAAVTSTSGTYILQNADGTISWAAPASSVAGSDTHIQFNDGGSAFGGSANFTWNDSQLAVVFPTTTTDAVQKALRLEADLTTGDMGDGFGVGIDFYIEDDVAANQLIGSIELDRSGADNSGDMRIYVQNTGAAENRLALLAGGDAVVELGDDGGTNKLSIQDSSPAEVAYINSDGDIDCEDITCNTIAAATVPDYTLTNPPGADRAIDYNSTTMHEMLAVLMTLVSDLQTIGLLQ